VILAQEEALAELVQPQRNIEFGGELMSTHAFGGQPAYFYCVTVFKLSLGMSFSFDAYEVAALNAALCILFLLSITCK
jgi:hypothetical protein